MKSTFNLVKNHVTLTHNYKSFSVVQRPYYYKGVERKLQYPNHLNVKVKGKYHYEFIEGQCNRSCGCDKNNLCSYPCDLEKSEWVLGHATTNLNIPAAELVDKYKFTFPGKKTIFNQNMDQHAIGYKKQVPTNPTEYVENPQITQFMYLPANSTTIVKETAQAIK